MLYPLIFEPIYKETIWGGSKLNTVLGFDSPYEKTGEAWTISCRKEEMCYVKNGTYAGLTFEDVLNKDPKGFLGEDMYKEPSFPLLIKIIDADSNLSVQVHPDDIYAKSQENYPFGKNELWYIMDAPKDAKLIIGLKDNVSKEEFELSIKDGDLEKNLNYLPVKEGDIIDIPAGLVHAITCGVVILEIQQNSDITYRIYDYNRKDSKGNTRDLHIKQSLEVIDFSGKIKKTSIDASPKSINDNNITYCASNKYFTIEKYDIIKELVEITNKKYFSIFSCISNEAKFVWGNESLLLKKGNSVFIPANLGKFSIIGEASLIKSYV